jgi:uncharacterized membrane protein (DUF485 family)
MLTPEEYRQAQDSPEFTELRRRFRRFAFPMTVAFFVWYLLYVLLSTYADDFMAEKVFGDVNLGILLGLAQFVTTFLITTLYVRHAGGHPCLRPRSRRTRPSASPRSTSRSSASSC